MSVPSTPAERPHRRWSLRRTILTILGVFLFIVAALVLFPGVFFGPFIARRMATEIERQTNTRAEVGGVGLTLWNGATLRDVRLFDRAAPKGAAPIFEAKRMHVG